MDDEALRARILARKALVDEGDYFAVLGVSRDATGYDIRRAFTTLRRELEPSQILTSRTADLADVVVEIISVLEEAYQILSDQRRRERYRRAIEATP
jgi:curved DNA-binding protein CbpA